MITDPDSRLKEEIMERERCSNEYGEATIDRISSNGLLGSYVLLLDRSYQRRIAAKEAPPKCFLTGKDLIRTGIPAGPVFGVILAECVRLQKEKRLTSRSDALLWVERTAVRDLV